MIKSIISKTEGLCAKSGARLAAKSNMECEVLKMARNAKDVERECGQFLEKLERQYERAEDQQRRSKTTSATVTARMGERRLRSLRRNRLRKSASTHRISRKRRPRTRRTRRTRKRTKSRMMRRITSHMTRHIKKPARMRTKARRRPGLISHRR